MPPGSQLESTLANDAPIDSSVATGPIPEDQHSHRWSLAKRIGFRLAFCYIAVWCLCSDNATVWYAIPIVGESIQGILARTLLLPAQFLASHLFHVPPPGDRIHPTGSGDTAINWIAILLAILLSLLATLIWSVLDRRRPHYQTLTAWLRFLVRLTLGFGMVTYGLDKVFPLQMSTPSITSLSEPLGMHSPMALLWNFIGLNPWYESICGAAEFFAGLLLLFRRTALAGALFTAFVVANVVLYNLFFDVTVKLYSIHLLLLALFLAMPDAKPLFRFFWLHQPAAPTGVWVPPSSRPWFRRATAIVEIAFAVLAIGGAAFLATVGTLHKRSAARVPCPLCADWRIESATLPSGAPAPLLAGQGHPATELILESPTQLVLRDQSGTPLYLPVTSTAETLELRGPNRAPAIYAISIPNPSRLILTPAPNQSPTNGTLTLTRLTPAGGYPLLHRGFHWVSEYPYQR